MIRQRIANLSKSIAPTWKPKTIYAAGSFCMYNGLRCKAKVANQDKQFTPSHWEFDDIGEGGTPTGNYVTNVDPTTCSGLQVVSTEPSTYTPNVIYFVKS